MRALWALPGGHACATNQVLYHLGDPGIEWDLLPWMRKHRMPLMAYCPLGEGRLLFDRKLAAIAARQGATAAQRVVKGCDHGAHYGFWPIGARRVGVNASWAW